MAPRMKNAPDAVVETIHGKGNLDARAYVASIVGPLRAVHGRRTSRPAVVNEIVQFAQNSGPARQWAYVEIALLGGVGTVKFSESGNVIGANGYPREVSVVAPLKTVIAPGENLYGLLVAGPPGLVYVTTLVWF